MFSNNGRISEKQMRRTLVLPVFAGCIFVLPHFAAKRFGDNMIWGIVCFFVLAVIYCTLIYRIGKWKEEMLEMYGERDGRSGIQKCVEMVSMIRYTIRLAFYLLLAIMILGEAQVPFMREGGGEKISNLFVLLPLLLVAFYGANHAMEKVVRIHEMVFWITFVPFVIMIAFGFREVDWSVWIPAGDMSVWEISANSLLLLPLVLPVENYLRLKKVYNEKSSIAISYSAVLSMIGLACVLSMLIAGIYGICGAAGQKMVTIAIMRYIRLPLGILERFDILMIWFFMTGCFVLICNALFMIRQMYREAFSKKYVWWIMVAACVIAGILVYFFPKYEYSLLLFLWYGILIDLPLSLILPFLEVAGSKRKSRRKVDKRRRDGEKVTARIKERRKRKKEELRKLNAVEKMCMWLFMGMFCVVALTGCGKDMRNVEQRDYATVLLVSKETNRDLYHIYLGIAKEHRVGEKSQVENVVDFEVATLSELKEKYEEQRGKSLSLMHIKVLLWDMENMKMQDEFADFLYELDKDNEVAKTSPVLGITDSGEFVSFLEQSETPVGTYVSALVQTFDRGNAKVPWMKDYLKYIREGTPVYVCQLEKAEQGWKIQYVHTDKVPFSRN